MECLKTLFTLILLIPLAYGAPPPKKLSPKETAEKLARIAAAIQNYEHQLSAVEHDLDQARAEENSILQEVDHHNQRLMETIHYLRHATQYSPLLAMLSASKPEDVIHSSMLIRSVTPEINFRNQQLLEKVKILSQIRAQLESKQEELRTITFKYYEERDNLDSLQITRPQPQAITGEIPQNDTEELILKKPVVGKVIPTYQSTNPEWAAYTQGILFTTRVEAQVVSPISGLIISAGDYAEGQGKMISIQTSNVLIMMSGMESLHTNCTAGQYINRGDPIGRMPKKISKKNNATVQSAPKLYLEVWRQEQTIDPQTVLN